MSLVTDNGAVQIDDTVSISICPFCQDDWVEARKEQFGSKEEAAPFFDIVLEVGDGPSSMLARSVWVVKCYACGRSWVQLNLYSTLFKND